MFLFSRLQHIDQAGHIGTLVRDGLGCSGTGLISNSTVDVPHLLAAHTPAAVAFSASTTLDFSLFLFRYRRIAHILCLAEAQDDSENAGEQHHANGEADALAKGLGQLMEAHEG